MRGKSPKLNISPLSASPWEKPEVWQTGSARGERMVDITCILAPFWIFLMLSIKKVGKFASLITSKTSPLDKVSKAEVRSVFRMHRFPLKLIEFSMKQRTFLMVSVHDSLLLYAVKKFGSILCFSNAILRRAEIVKVAHFSRILYRDIGL